MKTSNAIYYLLLVQAARINGAVKSPGNLAIWLPKLPGYFVLVALAFLATACRQDASSADGAGSSSVITISPDSVEERAFLPKASEYPLLLVLGSDFSVAAGLPPEQSYAALLQQSLSDGPLPLPVLNASVAGETAAGTSERLPYLLAHPLRQAVLELGQADEARRTAPGAFARDVQKLLRQIRTQHPNVPILILASSRTAAYYEPLAAAAEAIAGVRLSSLLLEAAGPLRSDDAALHRRLAEELLPLVNEEGAIPH